MNRQAIIDVEDRYGSGVYGHQPIVLVRGEGARLWDADGREYIDCMSGHGVANVGHAHPAVVEAIREQTGRLAICPNGFYNDARAALMETLVRIAPDGLDRVFLCNSGTEAVEGAMKFARIATGRTKIVAAMRGYHGRTMGALSATWNKMYREPFGPLVPDVAFVPYNRIEALEKVVDEGTSAVLLEIVQGEGGVIPGDAAYLQAAQELCAAHGALFVADEVQTGFGRTGAMFACEHHGLRPDLMCVAKAIAGGVPMGAILIGPRAGTLPPRAHSSTFGGNPLACAAGLATIGVLETEQLPARAAELGDRLRAGLEAIDVPVVRQVRGIGLMQAMELRVKSFPILAGLAERGVLALPAGKMVLRFLPPLVITEEQVDAVIDAVSTVLSTEEGTSDG
jgi:acetylornithine/LysW-gamma-L-lysine aminotransferase